ncbi:tetratricopeptide repeat protein [Streptomyces venezuelae]|uniref:tetratricopeptide repeat protein n=1 Tax=Streptomyces venezuelae TaxID=54571 RepID=UPI00332F7F19
MNGANDRISGTGGIQFNVQAGSSHTVTSVNVQPDGGDTYHLRPWRPTRSPDSTWLRALPSRMLRPEFAVTEFVGREQELEQLSAWRDSPRRSDVLLVHGAGGQGKTRLAQHFAERTLAEGWRVARALPGTGPGTGPGPGSEPGAAPLAEGAAARLLVVVDYADRWPFNSISDLVDQQMRRHGAASRVLLLARHPGAWWERLAQSLERFGIAPLVLALSPLAVTPRAGEVLFRSSVARFAEVLGVDPRAADGVRPPAEVGRTMDSALSIQAAALLAVESLASPPVGRPETPETAETSETSETSETPGTPGTSTQSADLLRREFGHWRALHASRKLTTTPEQMARLVFVATLTRPLRPAQAAAALLRADLAGTVGEARSLLADHEFCYPSENPGRVLQPISPERLGEDFLALTLPGHEVEGFPDDPWAPFAVHRLLTPDEESGDPPEYTTSAIGVLVEAAYRWPHVAVRSLNPVLLRNPELSGAVDAATMTRLADVPHLDTRVLAAVEPLLPAGRSAEADEAAAAVTRALVAGFRATASGEEQSPGLATLLTRLGYRLSRAGHLEEALGAGAEAVGLYRNLVAEDPGAFTPGLAAALNNLSGDLSRAGRWAEALEASQEAVVLYRALADSDPYAYLPGLGSVFGSFSGLLTVAGRRSEALSAAMESVDVKRAVARSGRPGSTPELAEALDVLGIRLSAVGRWSEAADAASEAVAIRRELAQADPDAHTPNLASSLNNLGGTLSGIGRREEALVATEEAAQLYRGLVHRDSHTFRPELAAVLSNYGSRLSAVGRWSEAADAASEAVAIRRELAQADPDAHTPGLAAALNGLGRILPVVGLSNEALQVSQEAVSLYRGLAAAHPEAHTPELAGALTNLGNRRAEAGCGPEALEASQEAVALYRYLAESDPGTHTPELAGALTNLGSRLDELGRGPDALVATAEAVSLYRALAGADPAGYEPALAQELTVLSIRQFELGMIREAAETSAEATGLYRRLAAAESADFELRLALGLQLTARMTAEGPGEPAAALRAVEEAVGIHERLGSRDDPGLSGLLRDALSIQAALLDRLGRPAEAADVRRRLVRII